jgi:hypothetical protein
MEGIRGIVALNIIHIYLFHRFSLVSCAVKKKPVILYESSRQLFGVVKDNTFQLPTIRERGYIRELGEYIQNIIAC